MYLTAHRHSMAIASAQCVRSFACTLSSVSGLLGTCCLLCKIYSLNTVSACLHWTKQLWFSRSWINRCWMISYHIFATNNYYLSQTSTMYVCSKRWVPLKIEKIDSPSPGPCILLSQIIITCTTNDKMLAKMESLPDQLNKWLQNTQLS